MSEARNDNEPIVLTELIEALRSHNFGSPECAGLVTRKLSDGRRYAVCDIALQEGADKRKADQKRALEARVKVLEEAIDGVLHFRVGQLPNKGWLRDNDQSRAALARLDQARSTGSPKP